jgi:hypothetical protein
VPGLPRGAPAGDRSCLTGGCGDLGGEISFLFLDALTE